LNRKIDLQLFLLILIATPLVFVIPFVVLIKTGSWALFYSSIVLLISFELMADILTVKLHKAEKRRGISKVLGHKIVD